MSDDYLWDRSGPPDPVVRALEELLSPLRHDGRGFEVARTAEPGMNPGAGAGRDGEAAGTAAPRDPDLRSTGEETDPPSLLARASSPARRMGGFRSRWGLAAAAAALVAAAAWLDLGPEAPSPDQIPLRIRGREIGLSSGEWFIATEKHRELELGDVGRLTLSPGSRLQVRRLAEERTNLYLARGEMEALVSADARPRFFQVATPATTCVDLGCRYTLTVDDAGNAEVVVHTGQVAFENEGREVYVPADATCRAVRGRGAGTPRFLDTPDGLAGAIDRFDAAAPSTGDHRLALALEVLRLVDDSRHTLAAWHFLQDRDPRVVSAAEQALTRVAGRPEGLTATPDGRPNPADRDVWKDHLTPAWW